MSIFSKISSLFESESSRMEKEINEKFYKLISNEANNNLVIDNDIFKYTFEKIPNKKAKKKLDINITHRINTSLDILIIRILKEGIANVTEDMQYFNIETNSGTILKLWNNSTIPDYFATSGYVIYRESSIEDISWEEIIPSYGMIYNLLKIIELCKLARANRNSLSLFINHYTNNLNDSFPASNTESDDSPEYDSGSDSSYYNDSGYSGGNHSHIAVTDANFENQLYMEEEEVLHFPSDYDIDANTFSKEERIQSLKTTPISKFFYIKKEDIDLLYDDARKKLF